VLAGWSQRATLLRGYLLMAAVAACAVVSPRLTTHEQWLLIGAWAVVYVLIHLKVSLIERASPTAGQSTRNHP
jgi:hypothetical protein